jgi:hypothetical protein
VLLGMKSLCPIPAISITAALQALQLGLHPLTEEEAEAQADEGPQPACGCGYDSSVLC